MRPRVSALVCENALCAFAAGAATATMAWLGPVRVRLERLRNRGPPAFDALTHGHVLEFLRLAPAYGGSLVERAPFALLPGLWGGGQLAVYRLVALPCLLAAAALGVWLVARMRAAAAPRRSHARSRRDLRRQPADPERAGNRASRGAARRRLCVAAVLLAARGERPLWAGWRWAWRSPTRSGRCSRSGRSCSRCPRRRHCGASLHAQRRGRRGGPARAACARGPRGFAAATRGAAAPPSAIFQPWQIFWFFGHHGTPVRGLFGGVKPGYRTGPAGSATISHPLIIARRRRRSPALAWSASGAAPERRARCCAGAAAAAAAACWTPGTRSTTRSPSCWRCSPGRPASAAAPAAAGALGSALVWFSFHWLPAHRLARRTVALSSSPGPLPLAVAGSPCGSSHRRRGALSRGRVAEAQLQPQAMTVSSLDSRVSTS